VSVDEIKWERASPYSTNIRLKGAKAQKEYLKCYGFTPHKDGLFNPNLPLDLDIALTEIQHKRVVSQAFSRLESHLAYKEPASKKTRFGFSSDINGNMYLNCLATYQPNNLHDFNINVCGWRSKPSSVAGCILPPNHGGNHRCTALRKLKSGLYRCYYSIKCDVFSKDIIKARSDFDKLFEIQADEVKLVSEKFQISYAFWDQAKTIKYARHCPQTEPVQLDMFGLSDVQLSIGESWGCLAIHLKISK